MSLATKTKNQQNLEDAQRMERENRGGNQPTVKVAETPKVDTSPTQVEVDQSSATDVTTPEVETSNNPSRSTSKLVVLWILILVILSTNLVGPKDILPLPGVVLGATIV